MATDVNGVNDIWGNNGTNPMDTVSGTGSSKKSSSALDMTDFLKLMAAQFQNQNIDSQTDNTQYITELAQFSAIQAMTSMSQTFNKEYAASLVGSDVVLSTTDKNTGVTTLTQGTVQKACFNSSGDSYLLVNDKVYDLSDVIEVLGYHSADSSGGSGDDGDGGSGSEPTNPTT
ncbi:MAG: hypothetical protein LKJ73_00910 [Oscillospiraceae bacterium]|jgi:flagellar basal-body rod modification protein FlgD|nr:hypothetical protein [Oscillospiraceae bacterium]